MAKAKEKVQIRNYFMSTTNKRTITTTDTITQVCFYNGTEAKAKATTAAITQVGMSHAIIIAKSKNYKNNKCVTNICTHLICTLAPLLNNRSAKGRSWTLTAGHFATFVYLYVCIYVFVDKLIRTTTAI